MISSSSMDKKIYFIDFGLAITSLKAEDKAVDIHLFRQALESKHHKVFAHCYRIFLKGYRETNPDELVMERLKIVESRGRHKAKT
jgi:Kae1-associated kinase Bud32